MEISVIVRKCEALEYFGDIKGTDEESDIEGERSAGGKKGEEKQIGANIWQQLVEKKQVRMRDKEKKGGG